MQLLSQYALFFFEALTIVVAIIVVLISIVAIASKGKIKQRLELSKLNEKFNTTRQLMRDEILSKKDLKVAAKNDKAELKKQKSEQRKRVFVLDFIGDIKASETTQLREEVTAILSIATKEDEVLLRLESPGGVVHGYGLAASQLQRIRDQGIPLTIAVDKVAASGGYMMACVADKILAAPFAIIGSIGVVLQMPNFNKWLKKHNIEYEQVTSGEYKRTLTMFGENTDKGREKMQEELNDVHKLFKEFIEEHRPAVDIDKVSTGEYWFAKRALDLKLVDMLQTSDQYLIDLSSTRDIYQVKYRIKKSLGQKLNHTVKQLAEFKLYH